MTRVLVHVCVVSDCFIYPHRRNPQTLLCLARRGRGNIWCFLWNTGQVLSERYKQGANQKLADRTNNLGDIARYARTEKHSINS